MGAAASIQHKSPKDLATRIPRLGRPDQEHPAWPSALGGRGLLVFFTTASLILQSTVARDNKTLKRPFYILLSTVATLTAWGTEAQVAGTFPSKERTSFLQTQSLILTPKEVGQCTGLSTLAPMPESRTDPRKDPASPCEGKTPHPGGLKAATVQMRHEEFGPLTPTQSSENPGWAEWG